MQVIAKISDSDRVCVLQEARANSGHASGEDEQMVRDFWR